jgi:hypothetical protein
MTSNFFKKNNVSVVSRVKLEEIYLSEDGGMTETCGNQINSKKTYDVNVA